MKRLMTLMLALAFLSTIAVSAFAAGFEVRPHDPAAFAIAAT